MWYVWHVWHVLHVEITSTKTYLCFTRVCNMTSTKTHLRWKRDNYTLVHVNCCNCFFRHFLPTSSFSHFSRILFLAFFCLFVWEVVASKTVDIQIFEKFRSFLTFETLKLKTNSWKFLPLFLCVFANSAYSKNSLICCDL